MRLQTNWKLYAVYNFYTSVLTKLKDCSGSQAVMYAEQAVMSRQGWINAITDDLE